MSTVIRPEITKKSKYYISKERYYELKHFCLQYHEWEEAYREEIFKSQSSRMDGMPKGNMASNPVENRVLSSLCYSNRMDMVKKACEESGGDLSSYIFESVTDGRSYEYLRTNKDIPCCKDVFYDLYRRFFWILDKMRD